MRYFTPQLFERTNSPQFETAYKASLEWEKQARKYLDSLSKWIGDAPANVRKLTDNFCGHDAQIIGQALLGSSFFSLIVLDDDQELWQLKYQIVSEPISTKPISSNPCWSNQRTKLWLYDKLSQLRSGIYRHEILRDDGSILQIEFTDIRSHVTPRGKRYDLNLELPL